MASTSGTTLSESSLGSAFAAAREQGRGALVIYTTSGHPEPDRGLEALLALADAGADVIELGIPFSDPLADGPTIQRSSFEVIEKGVDLPWSLELLRRSFVHLWEQLRFSSRHPTQLVSGFSGTAEDTVPLPAAIPPGSEPAPGAVVEHFSSWVDGFGFMTLERLGAASWEVGVWDRHGQRRNRCTVEGSKSRCDLAQVSGK